MSGREKYINGQINLIDDIEKCVKERWPDMNQDKVNKISLAIYQGWSLSDINGTLEAIEMDIEKL